MSPKTLRRMLGCEVMEPFIPCGESCDLNKITMATDHILAKNMENVSRSSSSESLTDTVDNRYSDIAELIQMSEKLGFLEDPCPSPKETSLQVIVNLPDEENKKEQLSPKEEKTGHPAAPKNGRPTNSQETRGDKKCVGSGISLMPIRQTECSTAQKDFHISVSKDNVSQADTVASSSNFYSDNASCIVSPNLVLSQEEKVNENLQKMSKNLGTQKNSSNQRQKDRLNEEKRAESPREILQKMEKNRPRSEFDKNSDSKGGNLKQKPRAESQKEEKMKRNKIDKNRESSERGQDFDSMYRLPTEHLRHRRARRGDDRLSSRVESQLRIHEQRNSQLKLAEFERERCIGAMGGCHLPPPGTGSSQEDIPALLGQQRSRSSSGSSETDAIFTNDLPRRSEH